VVVTTTLSVVVVVVVVVVVEVVDVVVAGTVVVVTTVVVAGGVTGLSESATTRDGTEFSERREVACSAVVCARMTRKRVTTAVVVAVTLGAELTCDGGATTRSATTIDAARASVTVPVVIHDVKARSRPINPPRIPLTHAGPNLHSVSRKATRAQNRDSDMKTVNAASICGRHECQIS
jgi:hypothetical protein